jgi:hypothetical protein
MINVKRLIANFPRIIVDAVMLYQSPGRPLSSGLLECEAASQRRWFSPLVISHRGTRRLTLMFLSVKHGDTRSKLREASPKFLTLT